MMATKGKSKFNPKENFAIADAKFATIHRGRRIVKSYKSGERLDGRIMRREDYML